MKLFLPLLSAVCAVAQVQSPEPPLSLNVLTEGLADPVVAEVPGLTKEVLARGIDFDLGNRELTEILAAAAKGNRPPAEIAALVTAFLDTCQKCHARFLAPLTLEELLAVLKRGHDDDALLQEVKARRVKDLDISEGTANVLRAAGAREELINLLVPDDKVPTIPLIGYNILELKHAEDYDPSAPAGWLKVTAEFPAKSTGEFVFKHNSLFGRAVTGGEPTNLGSYFNEPAPRRTGIEFVDLNWSLEGGEVSGGDEKRSGGFFGIGKGKPKDEKTADAPVIEVAYLGGDADDRNAFQIRLANKQSNPQQYSFTIRWRVLAIPKPPDAGPKKPAPSSKK